MNFLNLKMTKKIIDFSPSVVISEESFPSQCVNYYASKLEIRTFLIFDKENKCTISKNFQNKVVLKKKTPARHKIGKTQKMKIIPCRFLTAKLL